MNSGLYVIFIAILIYLLISFARERGYYVFYPSQNLLFPISSDKEVDIVRNMYNKRSNQDMVEYDLTDLNGAHLFYRLLSPFGVSKEEIEKVIYNTRLMKTIYIYKYMLNRARPFQIDKQIVPPRHSNTYFTPSYPAGHVAQYYCAYKYFSKKYPDPTVIAKMKALVQLVERARITAGIHYPSDGEFSKKIVDANFDYFFSESTQV